MEETESMMENYRKSWPQQRWRMVNRQSCRESVGFKYSSPPDPPTREGLERFLFIRCETTVIQRASAPLWTRVKNKARRLRRLPAPLGAFGTTTPGLIVPTFTHVRSSPPKIQLRRDWQGIFRKRHYKQGIFIMFRTASRCDLLYVASVSLEIALRCIFLLK